MGKNKTADEAMQIIPGKSGIKEVVPPFGTYMPRIVIREYETRGGERRVKFIRDAKPADSRGQVVRFSADEWQAITAYVRGQIEDDIYREVGQDVLKRLGLR